MFWHLIMNCSRSEGAGRAGRMGAPQVTIETITVTRPLKVTISFQWDSTPEMYLKLANTLRRSFIHFYTPDSRNPHGCPFIDLLSRLTLDYKSEGGQLHEGDIHLQIKYRFTFYMLQTLWVWVEVLNKNVTRFWPAAMQTREKFKEI